jgi:hypothetical protein
LEEEWVQLLKIPTGQTRPCSGLGVGTVLSEGFAKEALLERRSQKRAFRSTEVRSKPRAAQECEIATDI